MSRTLYFINYVIVYSKQELLSSEHSTKFAESQLSEGRDYPKSSNSVPKNIVPPELISFAYWSWWRQFEYSGGNPRENVPPRCNKDIENEIGDNVNDD